MIFNDKKRLERCSYKVDSGEIRNAIFEENRKKSFYKRMIFELHKFQFKKKSSLYDRVRYGGDIK